MTIALVVSMASMRLVLYIVVGVVIGLIIGVSIASALMKPVRVAPTLPKEIVIGVAYPFTGYLSGYGLKYYRAVEMAIEDVNKFIREKLGLDVKFKVIKEDTKTSAEGAVKAIQSLSAKGVKVIVGFLASLCVEAVKSYADAHKIVVVSPASTAPALAIPGDYIFRFVPTDVHQGKALARLVWDSGVRKAVVIYRKDPWGEGLFKSFKANFEKLGGIVKGIGYDPMAKEHSAEVRKLADLVHDLGAGADVGVVLISFEDDGVDILRLAGESPVLMKVKWFGTDGTAFSTKIAKQVGDIVVKLGGMPHTCYFPPQSPISEEVNRRYRERYGEDMDPYARTSYDAIWVLALTILQVGKYDGEAIAKALPEVAKRYFGVSGWTILDDAGDRAFGDYGIIVLKYEDGRYVWKTIGIYHEITDSITWFKG